MNNKQYTTEEIINRLKAGERITAIDGCNMPNGKNALIIGRTYKVKEYFGGGDFEIESEEYKCHEFDAETFSQFFIFTSDYEKIKSEEKGMEAAYKTIQEEKKLPFVNIGSTTLIENNEIPEWLQRERVAHWSRCLAKNLIKYGSEQAGLEADRELIEFDKRFLNNYDGK